NLGVAVDQGDVRPLGGESRGDGPADAPGPARHDGGVSGDLQGHENSSPRQVKLNNRSTFSKFPRASGCVPIWSTIYFHKPRSSSDGSVSGPALPVPESGPPLILPVPCTTCPVPWDPLAEPAGPMTARPGRDCFRVGRPDCP